MPARSDFVIDGQKRCGRCKAAKAVAEFNTDRRRPSGYRPYCKACHRETCTDSRPPEYFREWRLARLAADPSIKVAAAEYARAYNASEHGKATRRRAQNAYYTTRPEERQRRNRRGYALRKGSDGSFSRDDWARVLSVFGGACAYCETGGKLTADHFVPVSCGGKHESSNIVPACKSCNSGKKNHDPFEWMDRRGIDSDRVVALICETRNR